MGIHSDYKLWMSNIASEYVMATNHKDSQYLPSRINLCYQVATGAIDRAENLRTCLVLDYTGYKDAQEEAHRFGHEAGGFFSMDMAGERWKTFGPLSGFNDPDTMIDYMRGAYRFVRLDVINLRRAEKPYLGQQ